MFTLIPLVVASLFTAAFASPPPETCDPQLINKCLRQFEVNFNSCDTDDIHCQCNSVIREGANCYAACPQESLTEFIKTYSDGKCADYDPYLSRRNDDSAEAAESPDVAKAVDAAATSIAVDAITVTPSSPTTTISLSPQEYQSRLEKQKYKENLKSIRSERARISEEAVAARNGVNKEATGSHAGSRALTATATATSTASTSSKEAKMKGASSKEQKKNGSSKVVVSAVLLVAGWLLSTPQLMHL